MQIFFQKDLLTLTYSHFLFYAWLGISASWERPPFVELREPETQLKEIKKGWDKIWEVKFDPLCGPLLQLKMKFTDLKKKSHLLKFRQFFSFPSRWPYCVYSLLSATFQEAFRAWNLTRVTHLKKKVNWWNFCHSIQLAKILAAAATQLATLINRRLYLRYWVSNIWRALHSSTLPLQRKIGTLTVFQTDTKESHSPKSTSQ